MEATPKWYLPVTILALLWNLLGCAAYLNDATISAEEVAQMPPEMQALYNARSTWAVAATATAVWGGAAGSFGLILRKRWAPWFLVASLLGVIVQDFGLFVLTDAAAQAGPIAFVLQGVVLLISIGLVVLARASSRREWLA